ncbi:MAG: glycosyl transferase [Gammaproteobacteria bacterium]|nr:glycosyl transferase [Gammaproteobacteria bacterium]
MERHAGPYCLWIICLDDELYEVLDLVNLENVKLLKLSDLETPELKEAKKNRNRAEYCWTLTPYAPRFIFEVDRSISQVTYLDADLWFRKNPNKIFEEFGSTGKSVLITDHAYAPEFDRSATSGQYCVQFMTFKAEVSENVRKWWEERCIEWCYARFEDGKFGDQKYLDDWPERFSKEVHVLGNKELLLAPWNATRFPYGNAICWHFHELQIGIKSDFITAQYGPYPIPRPSRINIYDLYTNDLKEVLTDEIITNFISKTFIKNNKKITYGVKQLLQNVALTIRNNLYPEKYDRNQLIKLKKI